MKLKNTLLALALLFATVLSVNIVTESTPKQTAAVKPFDRVVTTGRFNAIGEAVKAVPRHTGKEGAASFYAVDISDLGNSGNWRVVTDLCRADAEKAEEISNRVISGIVELPKDQAVLIEPFDMVTIQGLYRNQLEVSNATTKAAETKGVYFFYIVRQIDASQGDNQRTIALICEKDAKKHIAQSPDMIPASSEAGRAALTAGSEVAKKAEIPGTTATASPSSEAGRFFETQSSKGGRYTAMFPGSAKVEELDKATVAIMILFSNVKFSGNYGGMTEVSYQVARRATKKGVECYHITHQWQERGNNLTASAGPYK